MSQPYQRTNPGSAEIPPRLAGNPATGELVNLDDVTTVELVDLIERARELVGELGYHVDDLVAEVARRADRQNARTLTLEDGRKLETNAPVAEVYAVPRVRLALQRLVDADVLDAGIIATVIKTPAPKPPEPKLDKRELNKLKAHPDGRVARELGACRERLPQRRTLTIKHPGA